VCVCVCVVEGGQWFSNALVPDTGAAPAWPTILASLSPVPTLLVSVFWEEERSL
jgi:hypothetical protein